MVDFIGENIDLVYISDYFHDKIVKYNYEYITFLEYGLPSEIMEKTKFKLLNHKTGRIIIPIYFYPFVKKNIEINFFADNIDKDYFIFKADGDQDRPN